MASEYPTREELAAGFADDPVLRDFLAPINISSGGSIEGTIEHIAAAVRWTRPSAVVRLTILQPAPARSWSLDLSRKGCSVGERRDDLPDLEILTTLDVFQKMFGGELAPLQAFGQGRMRVRGNLEVARAFVRNLRGL